MKGTSIMNYQEELNLIIDNWLINIIYENYKPTSILKMIEDIQYDIIHCYHSNEANKIINYMNDKTINELTQLLTPLQEKIQKNYNSSIQ